MISSVSEVRERYCERVWVMSYTLQLYEKILPEVESSHHLLEVPMRYVHTSRG